MNKIYILISALILSSGITSSSFSQYYVTVGTGTSVTGAYNTGPTPFGTYYHDDRNHILYSAADIIAAGGYAGTITQLAFNVQAVGGQSMQGFNLSIGTTTASSLTTWASGLNTVYTNSNLNTTTGWNTFTFNTPFVWNGTDNIVIGTCFDNSSYTSDHSVYYTTVSSSVNYGQYADSWAGAGCSMTTGATNSYPTWRPNIRFTFLPPVPNDAGVASIVSPTLPTCELDSLDIEIMLQNMGSNTLHSCTIKYQIGSGSIVSTTWTGTVNPLGGTTAVTIGNASFTNGQQLHIWTEMPNGVPDSLASNDNAYITIATGLSGTYGIPSDFATLSAAATALNTFGVCGDVVMNIASGTYTEQINLGNILGVSDSATVTFRSATGNASSVTIQYTSTGSTDNWVVRMNGSDFVRFEDLTVRNNGTSIYANVFNLENGANDNIIQDCDIISGTLQSTYTGNYATSVYIPGTNHRTRILNNTISGGMNGIYSYATSSARSIGLEVRGNTFNNVYYMTTYMWYTDGIEFHDNTLTANTSLYVIAYGIYMYYCDKFNITGNYIGSSVSYGYGYPVYMIYCNGQNNPRSQFANNCIVAGSPSQTSYGYYGVLSQYSGIFDFHHNTITRYGSAGNMAVYFYQNGVISMKNNNIASMVSGYAFYNYGAFGITESDYNNLYTAGGTPFYFGTSTYSTLAAYQAASGFDMHSMQVDPQFQNVNTCVTCNDDLDGGGTVIAAISEDIEGNTRSASTPDIGAVEYVTGSSFSLGPDTTLCATTHVVEAGPAQLVLWNVNSNVTTGQTYTLENTTGAPVDYTIIANITTLYCGSGTDTVEIRMVPNADLGNDQHLCADDDATLSAGGASGSTYAWSTGDMTSSITVSDAGTYTVTKVEEGCESTDEIVLTKSTAVEIADIEACATDAPISVDATIPDGNSYAWSGGSSINTALNTIDASGAYSVTTTDSFACVSADSFNVVLLEEPIAVITYISSGGTVRIFSAASSQQIATNTTYSWVINGDNLTGQVVTYTFPWNGAATSYNVSLEVDNGCGLDATTSSVNVDPLGLDNVTSAGFSVFPNPVKDVLFISNTKGSAFNATVLDNTGRIVMNASMAAQAGVQELNTTELAAGTYFVRIIADGAAEVHTFVKQ